MSNRENDIIEMVKEALPKMSERDKGYFLGYAEALASHKKEEGEADPKEVEKEVV